ncbi:uncharacterized protein CXorf65 homolog isoform X2 [Phyllostomus discolor]|uniref:Uncharacterized protein CXorf65 homolog isoform X2 n=1 Tax=Phyllostomus discolor TaxID=89673 RepID=A0A7E6CZG6_9CHIR|nr:uncharacterized protein CXorf65 homolog isoform X2 [Phyllostomus discolor]
MFIYIKHGGEGASRRNWSTCAGLGRFEGSGDHRNSITREGPYAPFHLFSDSQIFIANTNCAVYHLLYYVRRKLGLSKRGSIDLCDTTGTMKLFFLMKKPGDYATKYLTARNTYYVCRVIRGKPGTPRANAFLAFVPLLKNPEHSVVEALRLQCALMERSRLKMLAIKQAKKLAKAESARSLASKKGGTKSTRKGAGQKLRVSFKTPTPKQKRKPNKK